MEKQKKKSRKNRNGSMIKRGHQKGAFQRKTENLFVVNKLELSNVFRSSNPIILGALKNNQKILTIGDGNLSFTLSLAVAFGAKNIIGTCYDSKEFMIQKYKESREICGRLEMMGVALHFKVDAMNLQEEEWLKDEKMDRIVFNFPHVGGSTEKDVERNQCLIFFFLNGAKKHLTSNGEINIALRSTKFYNSWDLSMIGKDAGYDITVDSFNSKVHDGYIPARTRPALRKSPNTSGALVYRMKVNKEVKEISSEILEKWNKLREEAEKLPNTDEEEGSEEGEGKEGVEGEDGDEEDAPQKKNDNKKDNHGDHNNNNNHNEKNNKKNLNENKNKNENKNLNENKNKNENENKNSKNNNNDNKSNKDDKKNNSKKGEGNDTPKGKDKNKNSKKADEDGMIEIPFPLNGSFSKMGIDRKSKSVDSNPAKKNNKKDNNNNNFNNKRENNNKKDINNKKDNKRGNSSNNGRDNERNNKKFKKDNNERNNERNKNNNNKDNNRERGRSGKRGADNNHRDFDDKNGKGYKREEKITSLKDVKKAPLKRSKSADNQNKQTEKLKTMSRKERKNFFGQISYTKKMREEKGKGGSVGRASGFKKSFGKSPGSSDNAGKRKRDTFYDGPNNFGKGGNKKSFGNNNNNKGSKKGKFKK